MNGPLPELVFVGGATLQLYLDEATAEAPRVTDDVDCVIEAATTGDFYRFEARLREMGFSNCMDSGAPICRWWVGDVKVDFMPMDGAALGFTNHRYRPGLSRTVNKTLPSGRMVRVFSPADFIAIKMEAHADRGGDDLRLSQDFEDVVVLLGSPGVHDVFMVELPEDVRRFLSSAFSTVIRDPRFDEAISATLEARRRSPEKVQRTKALIMALAGESL
jgi:hypothetical protein